MNLEDIKNHIPQREPFLFLDSVETITEDQIIAHKIFSGDEDFFKGHFPEYPVVPGVILSEAMFQAGAVLMGKLGENNQLGVVTRVKSSKFRELVRPPASLTIEVKLIEQVANACYFTGSIKNDSKKVMTSEFTCALIDRQ